MRNYNPDEKSKEKNWPKSSDPFFWVKLKFYAWRYSKNLFHWIGKHSIFGQPKLSVLTLYYHE